MIRALIVEDDPRHISALEDLLKTSTVKVEAISGFTNINDAVNGINKYKPDLVFLDIDLDGGENGFDILRKFEKQDFAIVFTTQHNTFSNAVLAIHACALDFLTKPVLASELEIALGRYNKKDNVRQIDTLKNNLHAGSNQAVWIRNTDGNTMIEIENIIYCESKNVWTTFHLKDPVNKKDKYVSSESIGTWEKTFANTCLIRAHRSFLVNLKYLTRYKSSLLTLENTKQIPVPRERREFMNQMLKICRNAQ